MQDAQDPKRVWCPTCREWQSLEDDGVYVSFRTQVTFERDGTSVLDDVNDAFLDYTHVSCGTKVRFTSNGRWSEELGEYAPDHSPMVEAYGPDPDAREARPEEVAYPTEPAFDGHDLIGVPNINADGHTEWGPSFVAMLDLWREVRGVS